ncbi:MAG: cutinase family protein [Aeromicrobium sp.]
MTARVTCALLGLVAVAACAGPAPGSPEQSHTSGELVSTRCADLVVLGVRGSGQAADRNRGVGKEVLRTVTDLAHRVGSRAGTSVRLEPVPYDASGAATTAVYFEHVGAGARMAERQADDIVDRCPDSRLALVGFSQGANVVHELADDVPAALAARIDLIGMIADPRRNPGDTIPQWSYAADPVMQPGLLGAGAPIDADVSKVAISFCVKGDEVCGGEGGGVVGNRTSRTHRFFYEKPTNAAVTAAQLDRVLQAGDS